MTPKAKLTIWFATLAIWLVVVGLGIALHEGDPAPGAFLPLTWFDNIFRKVGPFLPLIPMIARLLAECSPGAKDSFPSRWMKTLLEPLVVYVVMSVLRLGIYWTHLRIEASTLIDKFPEDIREDGHVVSDHIVLASSIIAILQMEAVLIFQEYQKRSSPFAGYQHMNRSKGQGSSKYVLLFVAVLVWAGLFGLVAGDMFFTAFHFHPRLQSGLGLAVGFIAFHLPGLLWIRFRV